MRLFLSLLCLFAVSCSQDGTNRKEDPSQNIISIEGVAMTIPYHMEIVRIDSKTTKNELQTVVDAVFAEINNVYNKWNPNSELSKINSMPAYEPRTISVQLARFLERTQVFVELTEGRFDPTIEPVQKLWKKYLEKGQVPSGAEIQALKPCVGWDKLILNGNVIIKKNDKVSIDLGAMAKGYAVDLLVEAFTVKGYKNVFIEWGGEVRVKGMHPSGRKWAVYIPNLEDLNPDHALAYVPLSDGEAVATSGDYLQQWTVMDKGAEVTYFHVFDPKTLRPLAITETSIASASVLARDCATANGMATPLLMCRSLEEAKALSEKFQNYFPEATFWILSHKDIPKKS